MLLRSTLGVSAIMWRKIVLTVVARASANAQMGSVVVRSAIGVQRTKLMRRYADNQNGDV